MTLILPDNMRAFERQLSTGQLNQIQAAISGRGQADRQADARPTTAT